MQHQLTILSESCHLPFIDGTLKDVRDEVFALRHMELEVDNIVSGLPSDDSEPFILTHPDLHCANIIIDEQLKIQGIIDWEFAGTVPRQLFTPPAWTTGHDGRELMGPFEQITGAFYTALELSQHEELKNLWRQSGESNSLFATARILSHPPKLESLFYRCIFPTMANGSQDDVVSQFFANDENALLAAEAERPLGLSERYTSYLKANGLYDDSVEEDPIVAEHMAKIRKILGME